MPIPNPYSAGSFRAKDAAGKVYTISAFRRDVQPAETFANEGTFPRPSITDTRPTTGTK